MLTAKMRNPPTNRFREYLDGLPHGGIALLARQLGIHTVYLSQLASRQDGRLPSPQLCVRIEQVTDGAVTRRDLRPGDWHLIWPELVTERFPAPVPTELLGTEGAPDPTPAALEVSHAG